MTHQKISSSLSFLSESEIIIFSSPRALTGETRLMSAAARETAGLEPIRGQYSCHVTCIDQSEASITCIDQSEASVYLMCAPDTGRKMVVRVNIASPELRPQ